MKIIEEVRVKLNKAIVSGHDKSTILNISRRMDRLIVEYMKLMNKKYVG